MLEAAVSNSPNAATVVPYPTLLASPQNIYPLSHRPQKPMPSSTQQPQNWSYEATVEQIEAAVARLEQGELPLAAVFSEFEQAVQQLKQCEEFLQARQEQVDLLIETLEEGV